MGLSRRQILGGVAALPVVGCRTNDPTQGSSPASSSSTPELPEARRAAGVVAATSSIDGAGVHLSRALGGRSLAMLDPFLLLDEIRSHDPREFEPGFPKHPHRGFETVTYMIDGAMEHADSIGNKGRLVGGSLQWMTAGRGIIHSEMPKQDRGAFWGLQLWVNLPRRLKMTAPRYQDLAPDRVPEIGGGAKTRILAGAHDGTKGPVDGVFVAPTMLDVTIAAGDTFTHELPVSHAAFMYVLDGVALVGADKTTVPARSLAVLGPGALAIARASSSPARVLLIAAAPIGEPVARRGPFVMNSEDELDRAYEDYRSGRLTEGT